MSIEPPAPNADLLELRKQLDAVDRAVIESLAKRLKIVSQVAKLKQGATSGIRDISREEQLLAKLANYARLAGIDTFLVTRVYREVLDYSVRLQQRRIASHPAQDSVRVGYVGSEGSPQHTAAMQAFATEEAEVSHAPYASAAALVKALEAGACEFGVMPLESSSFGSFHEAYDFLTSHRLTLVGEEIVRVEYVLAAAEPVPPLAIKRVFATSTARKECSDLLSSLGAEVVSVAEEDRAAQRVRETVDDGFSAAAMREERARRCGLHVIQRNVGNIKESYIRQAVLSVRALEFDTRIPCKTSIVFATGHARGALLACLQLFARHEVNLTKLESRPRPGSPWEYVFYVDFEGNLQDKRVKSVLRELGHNTSYLKVLGCYPSRTAREAKPAKSLPLPPVHALLAEARPQISLSSEVPPAEAEDAQLSTEQPAEPERDAALWRNRRDVGPTHQADGTTTFEIRGKGVGGTRRLILGAARQGTHLEWWERFGVVCRDLGVDVLCSSWPSPERGGFASDEDWRDHLEMLVQVGQLVELPLAVSVVSVEHVERAASKVDALQFHFTEVPTAPLLDSLGSCDRPLFLSRAPATPLHVAYEVAEALLCRGNKRLVLCEGGTPSWDKASSLVVDLATVARMRRETHLPVFVYPGRVEPVERLQDVVHAAFAVGSSGMVLSAEQSVLSSREETAWSSVVALARATP